MSITPTTAPKPTSPDQLIRAAQEPAQDSGLKHQTQAPSIGSNGKNLSLEASEARYRRLFEAAQDAILILDGDTLKIDDANPYLLDLLGYTLEELLGKELWEIGVFKDIEASKDTYQRLQEQGYVRYEDLPLETRDGRRAEVEFVSNLYMVGDERVIQCNIRDISARKSAEEALEKSAERNRFLLDAMPQIVWTSDATGKITYLNQHLIDYTALRLEDLNQYWDEPRLIHPEDLGESARAWQHSVETGAPLQLEHRIRRKDGAYRWHLSRALAERGADGKITLWVGTDTDVDDQKRIGEALKDADRRKTEFLAMLGHELRNPLAPIISSLEVMRLRGIEDPSQRRALAVVERQVKHITRLVDDLLDVSRITQGKVELHKQLMDLTALVEQAVEMTRPFIDARRLHLMVSLPAEPVRLEGDPTRLAQVLANLLHNAAKFTHQGGRIILTTGLEQGSVVLRVEDNGLGIDPSLLPHIFELFTQGTGSLDRAQSGLGIGLTLASRLVEMHGGTLKAFSAGRGRGSTFVVRLPALSWAPPQGPAEESEPLSSEPGRGRRVLVVDDNVDSAMSMAEVLQLWGYEPQVAYDGESAIEAALTFAPAVVLLDIGLPGTNGYDVARVLRERCGRDDLTLIAMTGYGQDEDRKKGEEAGFDLHFTKPVDLERLRKFLIGKEGPPAL